VGVGSLHGSVVCKGYGKYNEVEEMDRGAFEAREVALEAEHPDTLTSVSILVLVLQNQGKYNQAEDTN
jgi:hypothetical protein